MGAATAERDHGGGIDAAVSRWGGEPDDWLDLSTGINPTPFPLPALPPALWCALPDRAAIARLEQAARHFWRIPDAAGVLAAPGASSLIARLPHGLDLPAGKVAIRHDTYNEHAAAFARAGWTVTTQPASVAVHVHPNNPTGDWADLHLAPRTITIADESFCDTHPERSLIAQAGPGCVILKSFGKFWGLAGLRLGFAIGDPTILARLSDALGPWPISGPALRIGARALEDTSWAEVTRTRLTRDAQHLDRMICALPGVAVIGDSPLFRLYDTPEAAALHAHFGQHHILTRTFPYAPTWLRLGLPPNDGWRQLETALASYGTVGGAEAQPSAVNRP